MTRHAAALRLAALLCIALLIGMLTVRDFGQSWDEADNFRYADYAIGSYRSFFHPQDLPPFETDLNSKGPAYFMLAQAGGMLLSKLVPGWSLTEGRHFIFFMTFLGCGLTIYLLCRRWISEAASLGALVLFISQPLLWGHAFINPKDIPYMALFAGSILSGFAMVDNYGRGWRFGLLVILSAVLLGITSSVRVIGPLAALIVLGYGALRMGRKAVVLTVPYGVIALATLYMTWPYLWSAPVAHYLETIRTMSQFPFATQILFGGHLYKAGELPLSYFPSLLPLQLTESMLVLLAGGAAVSVVLWRSRRYRGPAGLFLAWFLIPVVLIIGSRSPIYDNGRQLYFLLPPLFVLAGVALDWIFVRFPQPILKAAVMLIAALPGLLIGARLHPYEYAYYNVLAGGTGGAFRIYETDYWGTSLKELTEFINATAAPGARIAVFGPQQIVALYARPDLQVAVAGDETVTGYDYAVMLTRENLDERRCKGGVIVDQVERRGAVFSMLKRIPAGIECK